MSEPIVVPDPISEEEQRRIVKELLQSRVYKGRLSAEAEFTLMLAGAATALGDRCPPHWQINLMCGRADRIMKEGR
jgi:hypothetical protein